MNADSTIKRPLSDADTESKANENNYPNIAKNAEGGQSRDSTTVFTSDATATSAQVQQFTPIPRDIYMSSSSYYEQGIKEFFAKPIPLKSSSLSTADVTGTSLFSAAMPSYAFTNFPVFGDKLKGFAGFRGDLHFRLVVNGNRFQQGRYMLIWYPTCGASMSTRNTAISNSHFTTLMQRTQLPHVEIDVNCDTEATLIVPYVSVLNYTPLKIASGTNGYGDIGQVSIWPYSPLVAPAGSTVASYTLWAHFENVELIGPTYPQSAGGLIKSSKKKSASEAEASAKGVGPISTFGYKMAQAANLFSDAPLLGSYATSLSWLSERMAGAASIFGWSKPRSDAPVGKMNRMIAPGLTNVDSVDTSEPLSLLSNAGTKVLPGFSGTNIDEMDFSYLKTIPSWHQTISWTTSQTSGTNLINLNTTCGLYNLTAVGSINAIHYHPFSFIGAHFRYWRGSLVFRIKIVKTEFHSGRLLVAFFPYDNYAGLANTPAFSDSVYVHREIVDIRQTNEIEFRVPYVAQVPWKTFNEYTGVFNVYVLDPLVTPGNVATTVSLLVEVAAGEDFEYAVPITNTLIPIQGITPQSGSGLLSASNKDCQLQSSDIGGSSINHDALVNTMATIGESITSFRTLVKKFEPIVASTDAVASKYTHWAVYSCEWAYYNGTLTPDFSTHNSCDLFGRLMSCYALSRGGVRAKFFVQGANSGGLSAPRIYYNNLLTDGTGWALATSPISRSANNLSVANSGDNLMDAISNVFTTPHIYQQWVGEVQIPQYHSMLARVSIENIITPNQAAATTFGTFWNSGVASYNQNQGSSGTRVTLMRAASDDANFGLFLAIPPMVVYQTSAKF